MTEHQYRIRPLKDQFGAKTVRQIRALQAALDSLPLQDGAGRFYAKELKYSLEAGLLLASLHVATSFLELFVRDLLIYNSLRDLGTADKKNVTNLLNHLNTLEKKFEDSTTPQWSFSRMVDELEDRRIIDISDAKAIKNYYKTVRVPIQHGLTRRFLRSHWESFLKSEVLDDFEFLLIGRVGRSHGLENQIEETALDLIKTAITFIKKYV